MTEGVVTPDDLLCVDRLAEAQFLHEYLDIGLGAVGLFVDGSPTHAGYSETPLNSVTFAGLGVDGIHVGSVTDQDRVDARAPVVLTIPMEFDQPNFIVGESLFDFLCLGCRQGYSDLANLGQDASEALRALNAQGGDWFDDRIPGILALLRRELSLTPWPEPHDHFHRLQERFMPLLKMAGDIDGGKE